MQVDQGSQHFKTFIKYFEVPRKKALVGPLQMVACQTNAFIDVASKSPTHS